MPFKITRNVLPVGAILVSEHMPAMHSACIGFWVRFGSRIEPEKLSGSAHFIEHMLFKGTATRSPRDIATEIESVGGAINAMTGKESTCYYVKLLPENIPLGIRILADMFRNSTFPEDEFTREKEVILEEIKSRDDEPEDLAYDTFIEDTFGSGPIGHSILGDEKTIGAMTRDELHAAWRAAYTPPDLVVAAAGNLGRHNLARILQKELNGALPRARPKRPRLDPCEFQPGIRIHPHDIEQTQVCVGARGVSYQHRDRYVYSILDMLLSGGMSSRLFQEIREKRGLVYDVHSENLYFSDSGLFSVTTSTRPANMDEVLRLILEELAKILRGEIRPDELDRVKQQLRASITMSLESVTSRMMKTARSEIFRAHSVSDAEILERIRSVSLPDIRRVAKDIFRPDRLAFTLLGPFSARERRAVTRKIEKRIEKL